MHISKIAMIAIAGVFSVLGVSIPGHAQWLFTELPNAVNAVDRDAAIDPTIIRSRLVEIDWGLINSTQRGAQARVGQDAGMLLNFFQDIVLNAVSDRSEVRTRENFTWHGHIDGVPDSQVILVALDGVLVGNIRAAGRYFQVRYIGNGVHVVREIDELSFPPEGEPIPINLTSPSALKIPEQRAADSGARFDVMVLYTPAALAAGGGTAAMTALANLAVAETNTAYSRSGVIPQVRLVYTGEVSDYTEVGDFNTDLSRLRSPSDGFMDDIHSLRNAVGADMVSLIIEGNGSLCGIGYIMLTESAGFNESAFSVSARNCATGNYTFGHELGHNMGLRHDRIDDPANGVFPHSHGYVDVINNFRDIMGVASGCGGCPRIQNFSNPNVFYNGFSTGVPQSAPNSADAAASLNATAFTVANWRQEVAQSTVLDTILDSGPAVEGGTTNSTTAVFTFTSTVPSATFKCSLDTAPFTVCTSPKTYTRLRAGSRNFKVHAIAGGVSDPTPASFGWIIDTIAPNTTITVFPALLTKNPIATFEFISTELGGGFQCSLDASPFTPCTSPFISGALADGKHNFQVKALDSVGNADRSAAKAKAWTVDTTPPITTIMGKPANPTTFTSATFRFKSEIKSTFVCKLDDGAFEACKSGKRYIGLLPGAHTFQVQATDAATNVEQIPAIYSWTQN